MRLPSLLIVSIFLSPSNGQSGAISGQEILSLIETAMQEYQQPIPAITAPIRAFPRCDHTPEVAPVTREWSQAELRCHAPAPWRRVIRLGPTDLAAAPDSKPAPMPAPDTGLSVVAKRPLARGQRITAADVAIQPGPNRLGMLRDVETVIGRRVRVSLMTDQPILERHLEPDHHISNGEKIMLQLSQGGIDVGISAIALENGWQGDRIRVRPWNSDRIVQAEIIAPGMVRVRPNILP